MHLQHRKEARKFGLVLGGFFIEREGIHRSIAWKIEFVFFVHLFDGEVALLECRRRQGVADEVIVLVTLHLAPKYHSTLQPFLPLPLQHGHLQRSYASGI